MASICPRCGFDNPPGMRFCGNCGLKLPQGPEPLVAGTPLRQLAGSDLADRFRSAGLDVIGQRRNVTVLFVDLSGYTSLAAQLDPEELYYLIQEYLQTMAQSVYKFDGFVDKFLGDGLMALFGAPIAVESHAELAVRAALDMQTSIAPLNEKLRQEYEGTTIKLHAGLHSGTVIVGNVGSDMMMDYTAIGNTVNLASRLEGTAPSGAILASETVYGQTRAIFRFLRLPPMKLKGIAESVTAYQVIGERAKRGLVRGLEGISPPLVGRQEELRRLTEAIEALSRRRSGGLILIRGEGGIGKSRLVREAKSAAGQGIRIVEGFSLTYRRSVAYWLFRDALRNLIHAPQNASEDWLRASFRGLGQDVLGARYPQHRAYLEYVLGIPPADETDAQRLSQLEAEQLRQRIFIALRDFLLFLAHQRPVLLVLEDLHWADEASLALLDYLLGALRETPILVLGVTRPQHASALQTTLDKAGRILREHFVLIELQQLNAAQSETLLGGLLNLSELPPEIREQILQRAAGIPFYLEEMVRMLLDRGILQRVGNAIKAAGPIQTDLTQLGVPDSLQGLILTRFDQLPSAGRQALQVASAIGREFDLPLLQEVLLSSEDSAFEEVIALLTEREFILPVPGSAPPKYAFRHELVSDAIYGTILRRERAILHGQIGEAIEKLYADQIPAYIELLARHYSWSNRPKRALHYLLLAGQRALRNYANTQAEQHFSQAIALFDKTAPTLRQYVQAHTGMGDILLLTGKYGDARHHYRAALEHLSAGETYARSLARSVLQRKIAITHERQGEYEKALEQLRQAENALNTTARLQPTERAQILEDIGWIFFRRGDLETAESHLKRALLLVQDSDALAVIASILNRLGGIYYQKDDLETASEYVNRSLALREKIGDLVAVARSYNNLGLLRWKSGQWDAALEVFQKSLQIHTTVGDVEGTAELHSNLGLIYADKGAFAQAEKHLAESMRIARETGHRFIEGITHMYFGYRYLLEENWEEGIAHMQASQGIFESIGAHENLVSLYEGLGVAFASQGDTEQARQYQRALHKLLQSPATGALSNEVSTARLQRLEAVILETKEAWEKAKTRLSQALQAFQRARLQLETGRTLHMLAETEFQLDEYLPAHEHVLQAKSIFQSLGATVDAGKAARLERILRPFVRLQRGKA